MTYVITYLIIGFLIGIFICKAIGMGNEDSVLGGTVDFGDYIIITVCSLLIALIWPVIVVFALLTLFVKFIVESF